MISFFFEGINYKLKEKRKLKSWIKDVGQIFSKEFGEINYVFCNDIYLLDINKTYLNHDYFTDIITFDQSDSGGKIDGDIYISVERVIENATINNVLVDAELKRVMIHGILHLLGLGDASFEEKEVMRKQEDLMLELFERA